MKKTLLLCLLGYLCLPISTTIAQVSYPPGADFLHRSRPTVSFAIGDIHRSGFTRSDTLPEGFDLVDHSGLPAGKRATDLAVSDLKAGVQGQKGFRSSASAGEVLIYGELINPDSLSPLMIVSTPYYLDPSSSYLRTEHTITPVRGEFFDGVLNLRTQKFSVGFELGERPGYFTLFLGERPLLEDYLAYPGDSLKVSLDLTQMDLLFGGENGAFYEAQYAVKREQKRNAFLAPRQLITSRSASLFQRPECREKMEEFKEHFGARLLVLEPGEESLEYLLQGLEQPAALTAQLGVLENYAGDLKPAEYDLLKAEIICGYYYSGLAAYRKFHHPYVKSLPDIDQERYRERVKGIIDKTGIKKFGLETLLVSASFLNLGLEMAILEAIWEGKSFLASVEESFSGEVSDRLHAAYLSNYLSALPDQEKYLRKFLDVTDSSPWRERILSLERSHIPGDTILPVSLVGLDGKRYTRQDLLGVPTVLYFYFSSCAHSADYFEDFLFPLFTKTQDLGYKLIAISVDTDPRLWKSRIGRYSDHSIVNLNLRGEDMDTWRNYYELYAYPKTMLLDEAGRIVNFDIRNLGKDYDSFEEGFLHLYNSEIYPTTTAEKKL